MMKSFYHVLVNTTIANVTTGFLWFALTFWAYLETQSVLATGIIGGSYMLLLSVFSIVFGTIVDHNKKKHVMVMSSVFTLACFMAAGLVYLYAPSEEITSWQSKYFWLFIGIVLSGAVVEHMRNIALSTTVTLLVPKERHANANGLVGTAQGVGFIVTSAFSGLSIGLLGMGWTLALAIAILAASLVHLVLVKIPEQGIMHDPELENKKIDLKGSIAAIRAVPGLMALILFSTFNNLIGGVYMTLMDPYGLTLFSVEAWGILFAVAGTGFVFGGMLITKFGLGKNPLRTLLLVGAVMGILGALFTIREWWLLYAVGIWLYMLIIPAAEAAEQTILQRVIPYKRQGRVFGFASAVETAATPMTALMIAPVAEFGIIPFMKSPEGKEMFGWLLGAGDARGIALVFLCSGLLMAAVCLVAFKTRSYRVLTKSYQAA